MVNSFVEDFLTHQPPRWSIVDCRLLPKSRRQVPITGLKTVFRDGLLKHVPEDVIKLANDGLERRGYKETGFLNAVAEVARTGITPAEKLLELYNGVWGQNIDPLFQELQY